MVSRRTIYPAEARDPLTRNQMVSGAAIATLLARARRSPGNASSAPSHRLKNDFASARIGVVSGSPFKVYGACRQRVSFGATRIQRPIRSPARREAHVYLFRLDFSLSRRIPVDCGNLV